MSDTEIKAISNEELKTLLVNNDIVILDIREDDEYREGHIPGSISLPLSNLENLLMGLDNEQVYYVLCRSGRRVDKSIPIFKKNGFSKVIKVTPGMIEWNGPVV